MGVYWQDGKGIQVSASTALTVDKTTRDGVEGYTFRLGAQSAFVAEADADAIARFMLFKQEPAADAVG